MTKKKTMEDQSAWKPVSQPVSNVTFNQRSVLTMELKTRPPVPLRTMMELGSTNGSLQIAHTKHSHFPGIQFVALGLCGILLRSARGTFAKTQTVQNVTKDGGPVFETKNMQFTTQRQK